MEWEVFRVRWIGEDDTLIYRIGVEKLSMMVMSKTMQVLCL